MNEKRAQRMQINSEDRSDEELLLSDIRNVLGLVRSSDLIDKITFIKALIKLESSIKANNVTAKIVRTSRNRLNDIKEKIR